MGLARPPSRALCRILELAAVSATPTIEEIHTTCAIAGGGPAGMMLGFLLARAGVKVVVLEMHQDFLRDFRLIGAGDNSVMKRSAGNLRAACRPSSAARGCT